MSESARRLEVTKNDIIKSQKAELQLELIVRAKEAGYGYIVKSNTKSANGADCMSEPIDVRKA